MKPSFIVGIVTLAFLCGFAQASCLYKFGSASGSVWTPIGTNDTESICLGYAQDLVAGVNQNDIILVGYYEAYQQGCRGPPCHSLYHDYTTIFTSPGFSWTGVTNFSRGNGINVVVRSGRSVYIGGQFVLGSDVDSVAVMNDYLSPSLASLGNGVNGDVRCLAIMGDQLLVGGSFPPPSLSQTPANPAPINNFALWNITSHGWIIIPPSTRYLPQQPTAFTVLSCTQAYIADLKFSGDRSEIILFDGESFTGPVLIIDGIVNSLTHAADVLYIGGAFSHVRRPHDDRDTEVHNVVSLNVTSGVVSIMSGGVQSGKIEATTVHDMEFLNADQIIVAGSFATAGDNVIASSIAKYTISSGVWEPVGTGFYGIVKTVLIQPNDGIYAGLWYYSHPVIVTPFVTVLYILGALLVFAFVLLAAYFLLTRCKYPEHPLHDSVSRWCTSVILLACVMTQGSLSQRVGITSQVSWITLGSVYTAELWVEYARAGQWVCSALAALVFGYLSNVHSFRILISVSMGFGILGIVMFIALQNLAMLVVGYCLTGIGYGTAFVIVLIYHARVTSLSGLVAPIVAFYFASNMWPDLLSNLTKSVLNLGILPQDFVSHDFFHILICLGLVILIWCAVRPENDIVDPIQLRLRDQFRLNPFPPVFLTCLYVVSRSCGWILHAHPQLFVIDQFTDVWISASGLVLSLLLLLIIYGLSHRGVDSRTLAMISIVLVILGCAIDITVTMLSGSGTVDPLSLEIPFLLSNKLIYGSNLVLWALIMALFIGVITPTSKGTLVGILASAGIVSTGIGQVVIYVCTRQYDFDVNAQAYLIGGTGGAVLLMGFIFYKTYHNFAPYVTVPFLPAHKSFFSLPSAADSVKSKHVGETDLTVPLRASAADEFSGLD